MNFKTDPEFMKKRIEAMQKKHEKPGLDIDFMFNIKLPTYSVRDGKNHIRLVESVWLEDSPYSWYEGNVHYGVGPTGKAMYFCPRFMVNAPCPLCEIADMEKIKGTPREVYGKLYPTMRAFSWILDRFDESKGLQCWTFPTGKPNTKFGDAKLAIEIWHKSISEFTGRWVMLQDPEEGYDIMFTKTGQSIGTKYTNINKNDVPSPLHSDPALVQKWLTFAQENAFPKLVNIYDYDHIKNAISGVLTNNANVAQPIIESNQQTTLLHTTSVTSPSFVQDVKPVKQEVVQQTPSNILKLSSMSRQQMVSLLAERNVPKSDIDPDTWPDDKDLAQAISILTDLPLN